MERSRRHGANCEQVYRALRATHAPMTAYQLLDAVRRHGISAPPTVSPIGSNPSMPMSLASNLICITTRRYLPFAAIAARSKSYLIPRC
jgi:hypothetical protein